MKRNRRIFLLAISLCVCAAIAVSALAEGPVGALYRAGTALLFDTDNATLTAHAEFVYNGLPFKTLDATYKQDDVNSLLELKLLTPLLNGTLAETGFTVVGNGPVAYAIDPADNPYVYHTSSTAISRSILSSSTLSRALARLGALVVDATESSFADLITVTDGEDGAQYHVALREGQTPALVNAAGTVMAQLAAQRFFWVDYGWIGGMQQQEADEEPTEVMITYDDYSATFAEYYRKLYGEKLPDDFYDLLWGGDSEKSKRVNEQYQAVEDAIYKELVDVIYDTYDDGVALVKADGSVDYYATLTEYYVKNSLQTVDFADFDAAYCAYYQKITGEALSRDVLDAIYYSNNSELIDAYNKIYDQMMEEYLDLVRKDGKAALIYVNPDGSYRMVYDYDAYLRTLGTGKGTMTRRILRSLDALEIGDTDFVLATDKENRITSAEGTLGLIVIDARGTRNKLEIDFRFTADHYGDTSVASFDPKDFGVMSQKEYQQADIDTLNALSGQKEEEPALPDTIMFDGVSYQFFLDIPEDAPEGDL